MGHELTRIALEAAPRARPPWPRKGGPWPRLPLVRRRRVKGEAAAGGRDRRRPGRRRPPVDAVPRVRHDGLPGRRPDRPRRLLHSAPSGWLPRSGRRRPLVRDRAPTAWSSSAASGSTTRRSAATSNAPPPPRPPAARPTPPGPPSPRPRGRPEFLADGVMTPTRSGWARAEAGRLPEAAGGRAGHPGGWATRELPAATAVAAYAALADCEAFAARWGPRRGRWGSTRPGRRRSAATGR